MSVDGVPAGDGAVVAARFRRGLCSAILVFEALVVLFAVLVAKDLSDQPTGRTVALGVGTALACLLVAGLLRSRLGYVLGSALQVVVTLGGLIVPALWFLGAVFAGLWFASLYLAARIERLRS